MDNGKETVLGYLEDRCGPPGTVDRVNTPTPGNNDGLTPIVSASVLFTVVDLIHDLVQPETADLLARRIGLE